MQFEDQIYYHPGRIETKHEALTKQSTREFYLKVIYYSDPSEGVRITTQITHLRYFLETLLPVEPQVDNLGVLSMANLRHVPLQYMWKT
jgi:hypothetical protein